MFDLVLLPDLAITDPMADPTRSVRPEPAVPFSNRTAGLLARQRTAPKAYGIAIGTTAIAFVVTLLLKVELGNSAFLLFWPAVIGSALFGGIGPALLASVLGVIAVHYYVIPPLHAFQWTKLVANPVLPVFLVTSGFVGWLTTALRKAHVEAEARARQNELLAEELQAQAGELEQQLDESQTLREELEQSNDELAGAYEETRTARGQAEEANRVKTDFLAAMSHDLRTPLNAIVGYTDLLEVGVHGPLTDAQRDVLARMRRSSQHLKALVKDVLGFAKLDAGRLDFDIGRVGVHATLTGLGELVAPQAAAKGVRYEYAGCPPDLAVEADVDRLEQVLVNLLGNAVKFTGTGGRVTLAVETEPAAVSIAITDTGPGIPSDKIELAFEPFMQLSRDVATRTSGAGLGLAISRRLARAMRGDVTATSVPGLGSTFVVTLPRAVATTAPPP